MKQVSINSKCGKWKGLFALVDDEDYDLVSVLKWTGNLSHGTLYARTEIVIEGKVLTFSMHRFILGIPPQSKVDHRNGDGLDNRKLNLRLYDGTNNPKNRKLNSDNKTGFKGVSRCYGKFRAVIFANKEKFHLGVFERAEDAATAYDIAAMKLHGEFARTNRDMGLLC